MEAGAFPWEDALQHGIVWHCRNNMFVRAVRGMESAPRTYVPSVVVARFRRHIEILFRPFRRMTCCCIAAFHATSHSEPFNTLSG